MRILVFCMLLVGLWAAGAGAELIDESPAGFTCRGVYEFAAPPDEVWAALTNDIGQWWNKAHTFSGDSGNLFLTGEAGEEFGEKLPDGGTVTHMEVVQANKAKLLRLHGGLGPLQSMAVVAVLSVEFAAQGEGTQLTVTYVVGGYTAGGLAAIAAPVDRVIAEQFMLLQAYLAP